jgi:hypothetical protein
MEADFGDWYGLYAALDFSEAKPVVDIPALAQLQAGQNGNAMCSQARLNNIADGLFPMLLP